MSGLSNYDLIVEVSTRKKRDAMSFKVGLALTLKSVQGSPCRYKKLHIHLVGVFDLPEDTQEELVRQLMPLNCLAILHGFGRGVLAQVTGLNPGGPVILPAVNFVEVLKSQQERSP